MFNVVAWPVDIKDPKSSLIPRALLGFPLSSSPWDRLFVGGGIGIPKLMCRESVFRRRGLQSSEQTSDTRARCHSQPR